MKKHSSLGIDMESCRKRNGFFAAALKEGDILRVGEWEFRTRIFHQTLDPVVRTTGIHAHESLYELSLMDLGRMEYRIKDKVVEIAANRNDWIFIPAGQPHARTCLNPPSVILGYLFEIVSSREPSWPIRKLKREIERAGYHFSGTPELDRLHAELIEELMSDRALKAQRLSLLIKDLLLCFIREYLPFLSECCPVYKNDSELAMRIINSYIDENISRNLGLDEIASCCGLSSRHANRIFTGEYGVSIGKYIQEKRMNIARREVEGASRQIKVIALELGYDDISYFNRIFKKTFGLTPTECRLIRRDSDILSK